MLLNVIKFYIILLIWPILTRQGMHKIVYYIYGDVGWSWGARENFWIKINDA